MEDAVRSSGMTWTILQPSALMEIHLNSLAGWDVARRRATILSPGTAPVSYVSCSDVAAIGVQAMTEEGFDNLSVPIGGPAPSTPLEVVRLFESATGGAFEVRHVPLVAVKAMAWLFRVLDPVRASILGMAAHMAESGDVLQRTTPVGGRILRELTSVQEYAARESLLAVSSRPMKETGGWRGLLTTTTMSASVGAPTTTAATTGDERAQRCRRPSV